MRLLLHGQEEQEAATTVTKHHVSNSEQYLMKSVKLEDGSAVFLSSAEIKEKYEKGPYYSI